VIYNRVIFDELIGPTRSDLPFRFQEDLDVTWVGHPNCYFRISKHSLPFFENGAHSSSLFQPMNFPLTKASTIMFGSLLYSFAGHGVEMETDARENFLRSKIRNEWILQRKVEYAAFVSTLDGPKSKAENPDDVCVAGRGPRSHLS